MTAYEIIDRVRSKGISAPPTVYRALRRLIEEGLAHRVESMNAFVACAHPEDDHGAAVFLTCSRCESLSEFSDADIDTHFEKHARARGFSVDTFTIELRGLCQNCQSG